METQEKNTETLAISAINIVEKSILDYCKKTNKHLFLKDNKVFYKVLTVNINSDYYALSITFNGDFCKTEIYRINNTDFDYSIKNLINIGKFESAAKVAVHDLKNKYFFADYDGKKVSIKNFKLMKEKMKEVTKFVQDNLLKDNSTWFRSSNNMKGIQEGISGILKDMKPKI
jgi:hypothetical protein